MTLTVRNSQPDWTIVENCKARAQQGTHLAPGAADDALFVERGTGTLGAGNGALDVRPGPALIGGERVVVADGTPVSIRGGDGQPRRDVVYLAPDGALAVAEGTPGAFAWGDGIGESEQTIANAHRPAPRDMADLAGYPLAVVTVTTNANSLPTRAITQLRAEAPSEGETQEVSVSGRQVLSQSHTTVAVPGDYPTIQDALDNRPLIHGHEYVIDVADGHSEGDLYFGGDINWGVSEGNAGHGAPGENYQVQIIGNRSSEGAVTVDSLYTAGNTGVETPQIWGITFTGAPTPHMDENVCVSANGSTEVFLGDCWFDGSASSVADAAIQIYRTGAHLRRVDVGSAHATGLLIKRQGGKGITLRDCSGSPNTAVNIVEGGGFVEVEGGQINGSYNENSGRIFRSSDSIAHKTVAAKATISSDQTIPADGSWHKILLDNPVYNIGGLYDSTNNSMAFAEPGVYSLGVQTYWLSPTEGQRVEVGMDVSPGESNERGTTSENMGSSATGVGLTDQIIASPSQISDGFMVDLQAKVHSGSDGTLYASDQFSYLTAAKIGDHPL